MEDKDKKQTTVSRKTAVSLFITVLIPTIFVFILLIVFKLFILIPFFLLTIVLVAGIVNRKRPDFFPALRKAKREDTPQIKLSSEFRPSSSSTRRAYMMLVGLSQTGSQQITINSTPFVIGRGPTSDFCISDSYVSQRHLVIEYVAAEKLCYVTDVSTNGSYLNSVRMQNNIRRPLHQGDTLQIAGLMFRVEYAHF